MQPFLVAFLVLCAYGFQNASFYVKVRFSDASFRIWGKIGFADYTSLIDQREAMDNQFAGMTDIPFTYEEFEETRAKLINDVKSLMTEADKKFLISFESGQPEWDGYEFEYFKDYPSVQWKLLNLKKLGKQNPQKLQEEAEKLCAFFHKEGFL